MAGTLVGNAVNNLGSFLGSSGIPFFQQDRGWGELLGGVNPPSIGPSGNIPVGTQMYGGGEVQGPPGAPAGYKPNTQGATSIYTAPTGGQPTGGGQPQGPNLDSAYGDYFSALDQQMASLDPQRQGQEQIANNTYQQGYNTLNNQYTQNQGDLNTYQTKSLNQLGDALRQQFQSGNNLLGTRGASDSSAANQYAYALTKLGTQQRGDITTDVSRRQANLKSTYDTNVQNLELSKNSQLQQIAQWYADSQNQIRGLRADAQKQKSEQALNIAIQMANQISQQTAQQRSLLDQWATQKAQSLPQLTAMLAQNAQNLPTFQGINGTPNGGSSGGYNLFGYGNTNDQNKLFG